MDAPEGTSLEGSQEMAFKALKEIQGIPGVANIEPLVNPGGSGVTGGGGGSNVTHVHFNVQAVPVEDREETQAQRLIAEMRKRLLKYPAYRPSITARNALGSGEGAGGYAISLNILGPDLPQLAEYLPEDAGGRAEDAEPGRPQAEPERVEPRDPRRGRSQARGRSRRADVDDRQHPAARGVGRRSDLVLQGRPGAVSGQGPRPREPAAGRQGDRPADGAVADRPGAHRQHRENRGRSRAERAAALEPPVHGDAERQRRTGACARRSVERHPPDHDQPEPAADHVVPAAGAVEDSGRDDHEPGPGDQPGDDLRLHGAGGPVRELPAADRHHAGAADLGALRAVHAVDHAPDAEPVERARHAAAARHREEELDPAGRLRQHAARHRDAAARGDRAGLPHSSPPDSDDDLRDHRRADPDLARSRHRRDRPRRDRHHGDRRAVAVSVPDAAARPGRLREVRRAGANVRQSHLAQSAGQGEDTSAAGAGFGRTFLTVRRMAVGSMEAFRLFR